MKKIILFLFVSFILDSPVLKAMNLDSDLSEDFKKKGTKLRNAPSDSEAVIVSRIDDTSDLQLIKGKGFDREDEHIDAFNKEKYPFGVYKLVVDGKLVGLQSLSAQIEGDRLSACGVTDILEKYQGRKFGTILRTETAKIFSVYIGKQIDPHQPSLVSLDSCNEWCWGKNGSSLKSSLNAGYGIKYISAQFGGVIELSFPKDEDMWSNERTAILLKISRLLNEDNMKEALPQLINILKDLNYESGNDMLSFCGIMMFLFRDLNQDVKEQIDTYICDLSDDDRSRIIYFISHNNDDLPQNGSPLYNDFTKIKEFVNSYSSFRE